jgi:acetate kinase
MKRLCTGILERIGSKDSLLRHFYSDGREHDVSANCPHHTEAIEAVLNFLAGGPAGIGDQSEISVVGHRVVHGGEKFTRSTVINSEIVHMIEECCVLAPLHNPSNLEGIRAMQKMLPGVPQVAVFDTAFFSTIPKHVYLYGLPYELYEKYGIRRYGFHGTSHLYLSKRAAVLLGKRSFETNLVTLHIGNGVSITAIKNGLAYDHSMGFTPLEGAIMGTRCGDIDPAIPLYLMSREGFTASEMDVLLNRKSGLLGITGKYYDRRDIIKSADEGNERAKLAIEMECYRLRKYIGAYLASLGMVDAIVFSAGVGENVPLIRAKVCKGLEPLGVKIDQTKNEKAIGRSRETDISAVDSQIRTFVIPTNEELVMVEDIKALLEGKYDEHQRMEYSFERKDFQIQQY